MAVQITMKEIAKRAGVARQTVSKILNNKDHEISQDTRKRVLGIAQNLNYQPNYFAQSLKKGKTNCIGYVGEINYDTPSVGSYYYMATAIGIQQALSKTEEHYFLNMFTSQLGLDASYDRLVEFIKKRMVDGFIFNLLSLRIEEFEKQILPILRVSEVPFVVVHSSSDELQYNNIGMDAASGGYLVGEHIIKSGYGEVGFFLRLKESQKHAEPLIGLRKAYSEHGLSTDNIKVMHPLPSDNPRYLSQYRAGYHTFRTIETIPRVVFLPDDQEAFGAIKGIEDRGLRIPEDVAVIGFDDLEVYGPKVNNLTTVRHPFKEKGMEAARILLSLLEKEINGDRVHHITVKPHLVVRETCGGK